MGATNTSKLIARLERSLDSAVVVVMNHWLFNERAFDFDARAARIAVDVLERRKARGKTYEKLVIFAAGRGGHPVFEEVFLRVARALWGEVNVVVPFAGSGFVTRLSLLADNVFLHPYAALGAFDDGNVARTIASVNSDILADLRELPEDLPNAGELARTLGQRRLARTFLSSRGVAADQLDALTHGRLGREVGVEIEGLDGIGLPAATLDDETAALAWKLYRAFEDDLGLVDRPEPRYVESGIADEVEFAPAMGLDAAVIETVRDCARYVMDTGSPHPDTGVYLGRWEMA